MNANIYPDDAIAFVKEYCVNNGYTIAVAESVTSGHLQAAFSSANEAMQFFEGGITAYNIGQKCRHLKVGAIHAFQNNCVSQTVAQQMALNCCQLFQSDYGIGITGYAAPVPEYKINKPFAFFAIAFNGKVMLAKKIYPTKKESVQVQIEYACKVIRELRKCMNKG